MLVSTARNRTAWFERSGLAAEMFGQGASIAEVALITGANASTADVWCRNWRANCKAFMDGHSYGRQGPVPVSGGSHHDVPKPWPSYCVRCGAIGLTAS
jgi:hypothetical protein